MAHDDIHSPKYQKFKTDIPPVIERFEKKDWRQLCATYEAENGRPLKPVHHREGNSVPEDIFCPSCGAPHMYIYDNNGGRGAYFCKVCSQKFSTGRNTISPLKLKCPYCSKSLQPIKHRKYSTVHKCTNPKCAYYQDNLKKVKDETLLSNEKYRHKLHYLYRGFNVDFFKTSLDSLPGNASSLKFRKESAHIMSLCLTLHVNLGLSLRKTSQALRDPYGIQVSHTMVANYCKTAACVIKRFVDNYDYQKSATFIADETYIKVRGIKGYVWFIMDAVSRVIVGYQVSDNRSVGPCILAMRMAFRNIMKLPEKFRFIADGYSAYLLAAHQFALKEDNPLVFNVTQVIGLTNDDAVSTEFRPFKQIVERLNRTFKATYRCSCGYDNYDGADYAVSLWVAYYNFLRPHKSFNYRVLNEVDALSGADNMPGKWQLLIFLGQQTCLNLQKASAL